VRVRRRPPLTGNVTSLKTALEKMALCYLLLKSQGIFLAFLVVLALVFLKDEWK
jgi:hypothetical protein